MLEPANVGAGFYVFKEVQALGKVGWWPSGWSADDGLMSLAERELLRDTPYLFTIQCLAMYESIAKAQNAFELATELVMWPGAEDVERIGIELGDDSIALLFTASNRRRVGACLLRVRNIVTLVHLQSATLLAESAVRHFDKVLAQTESPTSDGELLSVSLTRALAGLEQAVTSVNLVRPASDDAQVEVWMSTGSEDWSEEARVVFSAIYRVVESRPEAIDGMSVVIEGPARHGLVGCDYDDFRRFDEGELTFDQLKDIWTVY